MLKTTLQPRVRHGRAAHRTRGTSPAYSEHPAAPNEAGILLISKDLGEYVGSREVIGSACASDSRLLATDLCSRAERSRNPIDEQVFRRICRQEGGHRIPSVLSTRGFWLLSYALAPNEAGILLIRKGM